MLAICVDSQWCHTASGKIFHVQNPPWHGDRRTVVLLLHLHVCIDYVSQIYWNPTNINVVIRVTTISLTTRSHHGIGVCNQYRQIVLSRAIMILHTYVNTRKSHWLNNTPLNIDISYHTRVIRVLSDLHWILDILSIYTHFNRLLMRH